MFRSRKSWKSSWRVLFFCGPNSTTSLLLVSFEAFFGIYDLDCILVRQQKVFIWRNYPSNPMRLVCSTCIYCKHQPNVTVYIIFTMECNVVLANLDYAVLATNHTWDGTEITSSWNDNWYVGTMLMWLQDFDLGCYTIRYQDTKDDCMLGSEIPTWNLHFPLFTAVDLANSPNKAVLREIGWMVGSIRLFGALPTTNYSNI